MGPIARVLLLIGLSLSLVVLGLEYSDFLMVLTLLLYMEFRVRRKRKPERNQKT